MRILLDHDDDDDDDDDPQGGDGACHDDDEDHVISIEDALDRLPMGAFQRRILLAAGLCSAADAMEILLLSFLAIVVDDDDDALFHSKSSSNTATSSSRSSSSSILTSIVFGGALLGSLTLGPLGDVLGRRRVFALTSATIAVFGVATAVTTTYQGLLVCRFLVGFGVGGLTVPYDTLAEFMPTAHRGRRLILLSYFWTVGSMMVPVAAYLTLGQQQQQADHHNNSTTTNWHRFVLVCALPSVLSTLLGILFVPESPRWLLTQQQQQQQGRPNDEALDVLRHAAAVNGQNPDRLFPRTLRLTITTTTTKEMTAPAAATRRRTMISLRELWRRPTWRRLCLCLGGIWLGYAFLYYGTVLAVTWMFAETTVDGGGGYDFDYGAIFVSASAEVVATTILLLTVDRCGRIRLQAVSFVLTGLAITCLFVSQHREGGRTLRVILAFLAHLWVMCGSILTWLTTAEVLPTQVRSTLHSATNALAKIGAAVSPYVVSKGTPPGVIATIMLLLSLGVAWLTLQLPETRGKPIGTAAASSNTAGSVEEQGNEEELDYLDGAAKDDDDAAFG